MPYLALGGLCPVLDLGQQRRLNPNPAMGDALAVGWVCRVMRTRKRSTVSVRVSSIDQSILIGEIMVSCEPQAAQ
jgi:hypothetical protein